MRYPYRIRHDDSRSVRFKKRLCNATMLAVALSRPLRLDGYRPPRRYGRSHADFNMDATWYVLWPFNLLTRAWHWWRLHRWCVEQWLIENGFMLIEEGDYYWNAKWVKPGTGGTRLRQFYDQRLNRERAPVLNKRNAAAYWAERLS